MRFIDITTDTKDTYQLIENEKVVFFMLNRSGDITFDLTQRGAAAHIFAFFTGDTAHEKQSLTLTQNHRAKETTSSLLVKSALSDQSELSYEGVIRITKEAVRSDASQESRNLLLSPSAKVSIKPSLEILANDVKCHHAATTNPLNREALFFAKARGLSEEQAKELLIQGFFNEAIERMETLGVNKNIIEEKMKLPTHDYARR